ALNDADTWHPADESFEFSEIGRNGPISVQIQSWSNLLMRGSKDHPMHNHPFTLIRVERRTNQGQRIGNVMWLIVIGNQRDHIDLLDVYWAYRQRFDIEHSFRFLKRNLLLDAFQTPELEHEQDWLTLVDGDAELTDSNTSVHLLLDRSAPVTMNVMPTGICKYLAASVIG
ncbi:MAG: hypothetical protein AAGD25_37685, partial [Cyanobacteria bacterium P01_F01_bin.150]